MRNILYAQLFFILIIAFATSTKSYAFNVAKHISNVNGLTNNSVNCILEDAEHTIWIGTWDGLNAYNGREITTFRYSKNNPNSISNNVIRQIIECKGSLWIATDNGINRLDKRTRLITRYYLRTDNKVPNQEKSFILGKSAAGDIICLIKGLGFFVYNDSEDEFNPINTDFASHIKDYSVSDSDRMLFLLNNGNTVHLTYNLLVNGGKQSDLRTVDIQTPVDKIFLSKDRFILNKDNKLFLLNPDFTVSQCIELDSSKPVSQVILAENKMYVSFIEGGCIHYDLKKNTFTYLNELSSQLSVFTLYSGSQNILWIGTDGQGLIQLYHYDSLSLIPQHYYKIFFLST